MMIIIKNNIYNRMYAIKLSKPDVNHWVLSSSNVNVIMVISVSAQC